MGILSILFIAAAVLLCGVAAATVADIVIAIYVVIMQIKHFDKD